MFYTSLSKIKNTISHMMKWSLQEALSSKKLEKWFQNFRWVLQPLLADFGANLTSCVDFVKSGGIGKA